MTSQMKCRFEVEGITPYKKGFGLSGRCTAGPIKIGDVFVFVLKKKTEHSEDHTVSPQRESIGKINLVVNEIQYFNKSILELQTSHSGGLYVLGEGAELLSQGCDIESA
jgi:hypothetical protein